MVFPSRKPKRVKYALNGEADEVTHWAYHTTPLADIHQEKYRTMTFWTC